MDPKQQYEVGGLLFDQPFKAVRLGHLGLWCDDVRQGERQLVDTLGLWQTERMVGKEGQLLGAFTTCNTDHHAFVAINPETADPVRRAYYDAGATINQISFQVNSLREVNEAHRFFKQHGAAIHRIGRDLPGSNWAVYAYDPDGHRVELFYGMEQVGWQGRSKPSAMYKHLPHEEFTLPEQPEVLEADHARAEGIDLLSGFGGGSTLPFVHDVGGVLLQRPFRVGAVGPVKLFVKDLGASEHFYTELIGLTKTAEVTFEGQRCVFLRAGTEHHSVALIPVALRARLGMSARTWLMSFGLQVQSYRQLRDARGFLLGAGLKEVQMPGELSPGIGHALHFMFDEIHCVQLYFEMAHVATEVADAAQSTSADWPERLEGHATSFAAHTRQGPLA